MVPQAASCATKRGGEQAGTGAAVAPMRIRWRSAPRRDSLGRRSRMVRHFHFAGPGAVGGNAMTR
jgi:hypothetical protein